jgi:hypothetical protein
MCPNRELCGYAYVFMDARGMAVGQRLVPSDALKPIFISPSLYLDTITMQMQWIGLL